MEIVNYIEGLKLRNEPSDNNLEYDVSRSTDAANQTIESFNSPTAQSLYDRKNQPTTLIPTLTSQTY